jgi:alpha-tubulin suppressor-like RCC1 family protein
MAITFTGITFTGGIQAGIFPNPTLNLWVWGNNANGQLGQNNLVYRSSPVQIGPANSWTSAGGYDTIIGIKNTNTLWAWGSNASGGIGDNTLIDRSSPVQVGILTNWSTSAGAAAGGTGGAMRAVKSDGTLWMWGPNPYGNLGLNDTVSRSSPVQVGGLTNWGTVINNYQYVFGAIKTDSTLWMWGRNSGIGNGALGDNTVVNKSSPVQIGSSTNWTSLAIGYGATSATTSDGKLWVWGGGGSGQLGLNIASAYRSSPTQVGILTNWSLVGGTAYSFTAIKSDGTMWSWGYPNNGQLGLNSTVYRSSPVQVGVDTAWSWVAGGKNHIVAKKTNGTLWVWGDNSAGEVGISTVANISSPVQIGALATWTSNAYGGLNTTIALSN